MKKTLITFIISIFLINSSFSQISTEFQLKEANKVAVTFFNNLHSEYINSNGKSESLIPETYTLVSPEIFDSLPWISSLEHDMVEFGEFRGRIEVSREFNSSFEGQPNGYYAIFQYESSYKNTSEHFEQLILQQNDKRKWKIIGWNYMFNSEE